MKGRKIHFTTKEDINSFIQKLTEKLKIDLSKTLSKEEQDKLINKLSARLIIDNEVDTYLLESEPVSNELSCNVQNQALAQKLIAIIANNLILANTQRSQKMLENELLKNSTEKTQIESKLKQSQNKLHEIETELEKRKNKLGEHNLKIGIGAVILPVSIGLCFTPVLPVALFGVFVGALCLLVGGIRKINDNAIIRILEKQKIELNQSIQSIGNLNQVAVRKRQASTPSQPASSKGHSAIATQNITSNSNNGNGFFSQSRDNQQQQNLTEDEIKRQRTATEKPYGRRSKTLS